MQKNNPPITGEGIQKLLNTFTLFFKILPNKNNIIANSKVYVELRFISNK